MTKEYGEIDNALTNNVKERRKGWRCWRELRFWGRVWRVMWMTLAVLWLFSFLQVLLGIFVNPMVTPLMVQRFFQQVTDNERAVRYDCKYVDIDDISPNLITAVVYAEDGLFQYHHGFDIKQMKIAYGENHSGRRFRGGSTISQQTAKNVFLPHTRNVLRKAIEAYYTVMIEHLWGKKRIMEVYLNVVEFGDGIYGCEAASQCYFGHSAENLTRREASQLAATLPSPLKRNPVHQTFYFKRRVSDIQQRFNWGNVDIDRPNDKIKEKYKNQENLWDFFVWYLKQH